MGIMTAGRKEPLTEAPENRKLILTSFMYHVYKSQHLSLHKDLKINPSVLRIKGVKLFFSVIRLTVLPNIVNNQIRSEMYKGTDPNVETQFNKLYIYPMDNVSILFADIKVSNFDV